MITAQFFLNEILEDDNTEFGGTNCVGETLKDFLLSVGQSFEIPMDDVNKWLQDCGIKPIKYYTIEVDSESNVSNFPERAYKSLENAERAASGMAHQYDNKSLAILHINDMNGETLSVVESLMPGINC